MQERISKKKLVKPLLSQEHLCNLHALFRLVVTY